MAILKAVKMPNGDLISVDLICSVRGFENGIGIFDSRNRISTWIEVKDDGKKQKIHDYFATVINNRRNAGQMDWGFLTGGGEAIKVIAPEPEIAKQTKGR